MASYIRAVREQKQLRIRIRISIFLHPLYTDNGFYIYDNYDTYEYNRMINNEGSGLIFNIFSLPNEKISLCVFSLWAQWVKSCPNPENISTTWKNVISFYPR